uniref:WD repeat-containing and planar cell polarity effector protein fritz homolog n=1 Tax=Oncorhynchus gorbuscha TaxID=8017 RepID=UPI001EAF3588
MSVPSEHHYYTDKQDFSESRGYSWTPTNRRPEKLRDSLEKLEELLQTNSVVHSRWKSKHCCQLMLSSGVLVTLALNGPQLDRVCVDRTLVGRLPANTVSDGPFRDPRQGLQTGSPDRDPRQGLQTGTPNRDSRQGLQTGTPDRVSN